MEYRYVKELVSGADSVRRKGERATSQRNENQSNTQLQERGCQAAEI